MRFGTYWADPGESGDYGKQAIQYLYFFSLFLMTIHEIYQQKGAALRSANIGVV